LAAGFEPYHVVADRAGLHEAFVRGQR
jgi:hypothetical protein